MDCLSVSLTILFLYIGTSTSQEPEFQCDFTNGECGITQVTSDKGEWLRSSLYKNYRPTFDGNNEENRVQFYLPNFNSRAGRMTFRYRGDDNSGHLELSVCADESHGTVHLIGSTSRWWTRREIHIRCNSLMKISVTAVQYERFSAPNIQVDDIAVYEIFSPNTTQDLLSPSTTSPVRPTKFGSGEEQTGSRLVALILKGDLSTIILSATIVVMTVTIIVGAIFLGVQRNRKGTSKKRTLKYRETKTPKAVENVYYSVIKGQISTSNKAPQPQHEKNDQVYGNDRYLPRPNLREPALTTCIKGH